MPFQQIIRKANVLASDSIFGVLFIVYQMGRLCGGAHEISGIKAPIFLCGWVGGGGVRGVGLGGGGVVVGAFV